MKNFQIEADPDTTLRKEVAAAVSEDQAFFYFRQTLERRSVRPIIQFHENGQWIVAIQDVYEKKLLSNRNTTLSNVYVEKRNSAIDIFITGNIEAYNRYRSPSKPVEAYFKNCSSFGLDISSQYCRLKSLDSKQSLQGKFRPLEDSTFNFPVTFCPTVTTTETGHSDEGQNLFTDDEIEVADALLQLTDPYMKSD